MARFWCWIENCSQLLSFYNSVLPFGRNDVLSLRLWPIVIGGQRMEDPKPTPSFALFHEELSFAPNWKLSSRIKFVSVDHFVVDQRFFLALGTQNGSIYLFERTNVSLHHLTTLIKEEGTVIELRFSPCGRRLACALSNGHLLVFSINLSSHQFECIRVSQQHRGRIIRAITWGGSDTIYSGDDSGFVFVTYVPSSKSQDFMSVPGAPIQNLGSPIVQMGSCGSQICVSTEKSVSLFDNETRTFCTVGSKSRHGKFGACFAPEKEGSVKLLCARPGYRIWQTNGDNVVTLTQMYKSFTNREPSRVWGMPLKTKEPNGRSGVLKFLRAFGNGILAFVDVLNNFYFVDFVAQTALDFLPCPAGLTDFSLSADGQLVVLLEANRICLLHFAPSAVALSLLANSTWISDAVEYVVTACAADRGLVMKHLEPEALARLIENAGEGDPRRQEMVSLLAELRIQRQEFLAELENRVKILGIDGEGNSRPEEVREERSDISENSFASSDFDPERPQPLKSRGSDLLLKVRTKLKETSSRVKQEMTSERAQNLMKKMKNTTSKMKLDAGQLMTKVNMIPTMTSPDVDSVAPMPLGTDQTDFDEVMRKVQRRPKSMSQPALNFVELEAAVFICWENANVRLVGDQLEANFQHLQEPSFRKFRTALKDFQAVFGRLLHTFHFFLYKDPAPSPKAAELKEGENGLEEQEKEMEEEEERLMLEKETMTVSADFWRSFPTPVKVQELCSRIAVLSFFVKLPTGRGPAAEPQEDGKAVQTCSITDTAPLPCRHQNDADLRLQEILEAEFETQGLYSEFGFVENAFVDYRQPLHADITFWRHCLQTIPVSRADFACHLHCITAFLDDSMSLYKSLDCSSMEFTNLLEKSIVSERLLGLFLLEMLFSKRPHQAVRFCVQNSIFVNFRDVFNLLSFHQRLSLWLDYVRLMREKEEGEFIAVLRSNDDLFLATCITCAVCEKYREPARPVCQTCGFEIFLSESGLKEEDHLISTLFSVTDHCWAMEVSEQWLLRKGYWNAYCRALVARQRTDLLISLAFKSDQKEMLAALPHIRWDELVTIISFMLRRQAPSCPLCGLQTAADLSSWSWPYIGDLISANLAPSRAVQLLSEVDLPDDANLGPLFRSLLDNFTAATSAKSSFAVLPPGAGTISAQCIQHWGKSLSDASECCLCGGLMTKVGVPEQDVVITPCCQNVFHTACLPHRDFCLVCLK